MAFERIKNFFKKSPDSGGGKVSMAEQTTTATPPAIDYDQLGAAIGKALAPSLASAIGESQKPVIEALGKLQPAAAQQQGAGGAGGADKAKPLSAEDVTRIVGEQLKTFQQSTQQSAQRQQFQDAKLKDLPPVYRNQLGSDPAKWAAEEQQIRDQYKADFKVSGATPPANVGGESGGGTPAAGAVDKSKLSPVQKIAQEFNKSDTWTAPGTSPAAATATTEAAAAAAR